MSALISASILAGDFGHLADEVVRLEQAKADMLHFDIMDGRFVPNITFGADIVKALRPLTKLQFDVHLMILEPEKYIESFAQAGADYITVHAESCTHLDRTLEYIRSYGVKAGVAINPSTHEDVLKYVLDKLDIVLVMSVNPGFAGQSFLTSQLDKIKNIKKMIHPGTIISVDGGVNNSTAKSIKECGADMLVSGSFIFNNQDYAKQIRLLK